MGQSSSVAYIWSTLVSTASVKLWTRVRLASLSWINHDRKVEETYIASNIPIPHFLFLGYYVSTKKKKDSGHWQSYWQLSLLLQYYCSMSFPTTENWFIAFFPKWRHRRHSRNAWVRTCNIARLLHATWKRVCCCMESAGVPRCALYDATTSIR